MRAVRLARARIHTSGGLLHITDDAVRLLLSTGEAREVQRAAFAASAQDGMVNAPPRIIIDAPEHEGCTLFKPASITRCDGGVDLAIKVIAVRPHNSTRTPAMATGPATVLVLDEVTGAVAAVVDGTFLTAQRTAAGSAVATSLQRSAMLPAPSTLVVFGAGLQAEAHVDALLDLHDTIDDVVVVNRSAPRAEALLAGESCSRLRVGAFVPSTDHTAVANAVARADIVVTATNATVPHFDGRVLKRGAHIIAVGAFTPAMNELDAACVSRCAIVVDTPEAWETGDLAQLGGERRAAVDCGTLGELIRAEGSAPRSNSRSNTGDIDCTLFKSVGVAFQDVAAGAAVVRAHQHQRRERREA